MVDRVVSQCFSLKLYRLPTKSRFLSVNGNTSKKSMTHRAIYHVFLSKIYRLPTKKRYGVFRCVNTFSFEVLPFTDKKQSGVVRCVKTLKALKA